MRPNLTYMDGSSKLLRAIAAQVSFGGSSCYILVPLLSPYPDLFPLVLTFTCVCPEIKTGPGAFSMSRRRPSGMLTIYEKVPPKKTP